MPHSVASTIDHVQVYRHGATVTRVLEVAPVEGAYPEAIEISGLPLGLRDETVKLTVTRPHGRATTSQLRVGLHVAPLREVPEPPDAARIKELRRELAIAHDRRAHMRTERELLQRMEVPARPGGRAGTPPPASPMTARVALESFVAEGLAARHEEEAQTLRQIEELEAELAELVEAQTRAERAHQIRPEEVTKTVVAHLHILDVPAAEGGDDDALEPMQLTLAYDVRGARWAPQYQCRIDEDGGDATILMRALVVQSSGEAWKGVKLSLSTAAPLTWTELPSLTSLRIGKTQPAPPERMGYRPPPSGGAALFSDFDADFTRASLLATSPDVWHPPERRSAPLPAEELVDAIFDVHARRRPAAPSPARENAAAQPPPPSSPEEMKTDAQGILEKMDEGAPARSSSADAMAFGASASMQRRTSTMADTLRTEAPKKRRKERSMTSDRATTRGGGGAPDGRADVPHDAFWSLHLNPATVRGDVRGKLQREDAMDRYRASLEHDDRALAFDLTEMIREAREEARSALHIAPPPGAHVPGEAGQFDYAYHSDDRVDIPSGDAFHSVPLGPRHTSCTLRYVTVPREAPHVFRIASITNPLDAPMLPGPAEVYVGDQYVLSTNLPTVAPHETFTLGLGVEQAIKCARNTSFREETSGKAVVATTALHHTIAIELINNLGRAVECEVRERIPHPAPDAEVVVEEVAVDPAWDVYDQEDAGPRAILQGGRRWVVKLEAQQTREVTAEYVVKIYANNELVGGNRRES